MEVETLRAYFVYNKTTEDERIDVPIFIFPHSSKHRYGMTATTPQCIVDFYPEIFPELDN